MDSRLSWTDDELRKKVGQLFVVGFHGHTPSEDIKTLITTHHVGAVILFARNVADVAQLENLTKSLQQIAEYGGHSQPLFIAIDQEGGLVTRIKAPIAVQIPGAMTLGATGSTDFAFAASLATAETLKSFGINMNYAPIADINSEPKNPVIGVRSPSDVPETVGRFVSAQVRGLREGGIVPCIKHFPGHGDTTVDSHYDLPVINKTKAEMEDCELVPFRRAVSEDIEAMMTAHIALPALGGQVGLPASLNPKAIAILREDLKYNGLIVSDCLEMDGVRSTFGTENGAVMALKAGTDCVMICHTMSAQVGAIEKVVEAIKSGDLCQEAIQMSFERLIKLKERFLGKSDTHAEGLFDRQTMNNKHTALATKIYARSATVVRSRTLPNAEYTGKNIVFLSPGKTPLPSGVVESGEEKTREPYISADFASVLRSQDLSFVEHKYYDEISISDSIFKLVDDASIVILCTRNANLSVYQKRIGLELGKRLQDKLIVIATCDPYDFLQDEAEIKNYITIYEPTVPAFKAAVDIIFGKATAKGHLPVQQPQRIINVMPFNRNRDTTAISNLWTETLPGWKLPIGTLAPLLDTPNGKHFVVYTDTHLHAFCLTYITATFAQIAVLAVDPSIRNRGIGSALVSHARNTWLRSPTSPTNLSFSIGSFSPRFWPAVPLSLASAISFFQHRGFRLSEVQPTSDLFADIRNYRNPGRVKDTTEQLKLDFAPWSPETYEGCLGAQPRTLRSPGCVAAFQRLADAGQHHEAMVALDKDGNQVGWTLMCSSAGLIAKDFAFLSLLGKEEGLDGSKVGLIACVGVDEKMRGKGVGLAMVSKAVENLKMRGMEGVLIEWVAIRGFYENLGFRHAWEYQGMEW